MAQSEQVAASASAEEGVERAPEEQAGAEEREGLADRLE